MIISRTPFRISFFGGGTDYPAWYREHGGVVLATSIDKYCYLTCRYLPPFFEHRIRVVYSKIENCLTIDDIQHPAVRETLRYFKMNRGIEIHHDGDLPARSGMGSSSSFAVGLINALHALQGRMASKEQLSKEAINLEQGILKENVGCQDQILAAYGGFNVITFMPNGEFTVRPVILPETRLKEFESHLMLFYTGIKRTASDIAASYVNGLDGKKRQLRIMKDLVEEGLTVLTGTGEIKAFGELLHEGWLAKKTLSESITNDEIENIYDKARQGGALGGKLIGAGGGGFMLLFVPPELQNKVKGKLPGLIHVPFNLEYSGSQIIFYTNEADYSKVEEYRNTQAVPIFRELTEIQTTSIKLIYDK
jgi:D-glycero-alpha-D-manno-heptose-7-phosphate kinase